MKTLMGLSMFAVLLVAGCGGSDGKGSSAEPTTEAPKIQLADACPKIQDALDEAYSGGKNDDESFANATMALIHEVDPKGKPLITSLATASLEKSLAMKDPAATPDERLAARGDWFDVMQRVTDTCQQLGAPLS